MTELALERAVTVAPRERPILFSAPMVRAILAGTKTITRRLVKPQPEHVSGATWIVRDGQHVPARDELCRGALDPIGPGVRCPYGAPGDRLWVRETWSLATGHYDPQCVRTAVRYEADGTIAAIDLSHAAGGHLACGLTYDRRRPSIFMPRWASRISLEVTAVRVERLHDITEADIIAEGCTVDVVAAATGTPWSDMPTLHHAWERMWRHINGDASFEANPWVWVVSFRRVS